MAAKPTSRWLKAGDEVTIEIEGIVRLTNPVAMEPALVLRPGHALRSRPAFPRSRYLTRLERPYQTAYFLVLSRSRWNIEQYFQLAKTDFGLDHYEGLGWRGFHHHLVPAVLALLFVTIVHLRFKKLSDVTL